MNDVSDILCSQILYVSRFFRINNFDFLFHFVLRLHFSTSIFILLGLKFFQINSFKIFNTVPWPLRVRTINLMSITFSNFNFLNFLFDFDNLSFFNFFSHYVFNLRFDFNCMRLLLIHVGEFRFVDNYYIFLVLIKATV